MKKILFIATVFTILGCKKSTAPQQIAASSTYSVSTITSLFQYPQGIAIDASGNLFIANGLFATVGEITSNGTASIILGTGKSGAQNGIGVAASFVTVGCIAVDANDNLFIGDEGNNLIRKASSGGSVSTLAGSGKSGDINGIGVQASFNVPAGIAVDISGNIYVSESAGNLIRKITSTGVVTTFAGNGQAGNGNGLGIAAYFNRPTGLAIDKSGNLFVADITNNLIRKITPDGTVTTYAGNGMAGNSNGSALQASFYQPSGLAFDSIGNLYIADAGNNLIREIDTKGNVTTIAGTGSQGTTNGISTSASFNDPQSLCVDTNGNIYVADTGNGLIRKIVINK